LLREDVLQTTKRRETFVVYCDLVGVEGESVEARRELLAVQVGLPWEEALGVVLDEHAESGLVVKHKRERWEVTSAGVYEGLQIRCDHRGGGPSSGGCDGLEFAQTHTTIPARLRQRRECRLRERRYGRGGAEETGQ